MERSPGLCPTQPHVLYSPMTSTQPVPMVPVPPGPGRVLPCKVSGGVSKDGAAGTNQDEGSPLQQGVGRKPERAQLGLLGTPRLQSELPEPGGAESSSAQGFTPSGDAGLSVRPGVGWTLARERPDPDSVGYTHRVPLTLGTAWLTRHGAGHGRAMRGCRGQLLWTGQRPSHGWAKPTLSLCLSFLIY